jgi:hypothetical protein
MRIDERLSVGTYLKATTGTADGLAWIVVCITSVICFLDILLGIHIIPLREVANPSKAIVLLLFSPLLGFLILVWLRQLPFNNYQLATWIRAVLCIITFLIINF